MRGVPKANRLFSWIASLAILLGALSPSLSHALQRTSGDPWTEICTAFGAALGHSADASAGIDDDAPSPAHPDGHLLQHCAGCTSHMAALGLPPVVLTLSRLPSLSWEAPPRVDLPLPRTADVWRAAQPRAPPAAA